MGKGKTAAWVETIPCLLSLSFLRSSSSGWKGVCHIPESLLWPPTYHPTYLISPTSKDGEENLTRMYP